jgi:tRNA modification GTPase
MSHSTDTIAALSTPPGESGLAVVRMSGPDALDVLSRVLRTPGGLAFREPWEHRRLYHGGFFGGDGERIDDVMAAVMRGPESYTGDDMVEFSCHGGTAVVARILETLYASDTRPAQAGEFTRRAFLNGKMDLIQAEAVADLIHARTEIQRVAAERQLAGGLSRRIDALADEMLSLLGLIEANIDFIEEDIDLIDVPAALAVVAHQREAVDDLLASAPMSRPLRDGFRVVIAGPVNAGKSSLFNRLVGESRAIVTEIPGTTRDVLREAVVIDGVPFVLHDTAGLRDGSADRVEVIGMDRASDAVQSADVVLFVVDASSAGQDEAQSARALRELDAARSIVVENKVDLPPGGMGRDWPAGLARVRVSARTGAGLDELRRAVVRLTGSEAIVRMARDRAILNARLVALMQEARTQLNDLGRLLRESESLELTAHQARAVLSQYEEATGRRYHEGLLDVIFSRFCIGK